MGKMFEFRTKLKTLVKESDSQEVTDILEPVDNLQFAERDHVFTRKADEYIDTIISQDVIHTGNLVTRGVVNVEGVIEGDMRCERLLLGQSGEITGAVVAEEAVLAGQVLGNIHADLVTLKSTARIRGDIYHRELSIELDAVFEGRSRIKELTRTPQVFRESEYKEPAG